MKILVIGEDLKVVSDELSKKGHSAKYCKYGEDGSFEMFMEKYDYIVTERDFTWYSYQDKRERDKYIQLLENLNDGGSKTPVLVMGFHKNESLKTYKYKYAKQISIESSLASDAFVKKLNSDSIKEAKNAIINYFESL